MHLFLKAFLLLVLVIKPALAEPGDKKLSELKSDLARIQGAIVATKAKMKEVKDVAFVPDLYFVLAELYVDESHYRYSIDRAENAKKPIAEVDFSDSVKAKRLAIETYQRYIENFPKSDNIDKALFFIAHEHREMSENELMIKGYLRLTKEYPQSKFWEESMIAVGDFYFEQKKDPAMGAEVFLKIIERPPTAYTALARYKLGWCYINLNKFELALTTFEKVIAVDLKNNKDELIVASKKKDMRKDTLLAMVWPYSELKIFNGEYADALKYFESMSGDRVTLLKVLNKLSKRLMLKNLVDKAIPIYLRLLEITHDPVELIATAEGFYDAFKKSKRYWSLIQVNELLAQGLIGMYPTGDLTPVDIEKARKNFEIIMRDVVTVLQKQARSTKTKIDIQNSISSAEAYLAAFPNNKYVAAISLNLAEIYFLNKSYSRAGYYYEVVSRLIKGGRKKEFQESAIQAYAFTMKRADSYGKLELTEAREGFREIGVSYLKSYPQSPACPMIQYNIARTYYDERDFDNAVNQLKLFIDKYPRHKDVPAAGQLILDSYNQREDYDNLIKAGRALIANSQIENAAFKADVAEIIRQSDYRRAQDKAGDPRSKEYAQKMLGFASKYQGTSLGDQVLYEAFIALKKKKDLQAYGPGEQLLAKHGDSKYAKEVVGAMGQMALATADYRRASKYFETFAQKYPQDPMSKTFLKNSASMRSLMGDSKEEIEDLKATEASIQEIARVMVGAQDWENLVALLTNKEGSSLTLKYWLGLGHYRLGHIGIALQQFGELSRFTANSFEEKTMAAHALYLTASIQLQAYKEIQLGSGKDEGELVKSKSAALANLTQQMNKVIGYGNGRWTIAALYEIGRANDEFSRFISKASIPAGLSSEQVNQYKSLIDGQAKQYKQKAKDSFESCTLNAEKFEIFTAFAGGCKSFGQEAVNESKELRILQRASEESPSASVSFRKQLLDNPKSEKLLIELAQAYLVSQDYAMAKLIFSRALELNPKSADLVAWIGVSNLYMNDLDGAGTSFKASIALSSKNALALHGLAGLYRHFEFNKRLKAVSARLKTTSVPKGPIHPWMRN